MNREEVLVTVGKIQHLVRLDRNERVSVDGKERGIRIQAMDSSTCTFTLDGSVYRAALIRMGEGKESTGFADLVVNGVLFHLRIDNHQSLLVRSLKRSMPSVNENHTIHAPMPGLVSRIEVKSGETVKPGSGLLILEAMKMENEIRSSVEGEIVDIRVREGQGVERNQVLAVIRSSTKH